MPDRRKVLKLSALGARPAHAVESAARLRQVTWIENGTGQVVAAIIPAEDVHEPGHCCCKNCPWDGDHG
jgi:hypothetical protein